ncbi:MAG: SufB/SufD family protein, partial [Gemmatimonadales bacterium]
MTAVAMQTAPGAAAVRMLRGFPDLAAAARRDADPPWLASLRDAGARRFAEVGLPGPKDEEWRFTPLQGLGSSAFRIPTSRAAHPGADIAPFLIDAGFNRLVFVDGRRDESFSRQGGMPEGVVCASLHSSIANGDRWLPEALGRVAPIETSPFVALNAALLADGVVLRIPDGIEIDTPVHVINVMSAAGSGAIVAPRMLIELGEGARATVLETFAGADGAAGYFVDSCTEIMLGAGARLEHVRIQREGPTGWHVGRTAVRHGEASHFRSVTLALGARLSRHDLDARLDAPEIETLLYGLYLGQGEQLVDNHTTIRHDHP